jgi:hypothetical protein
MLHSPFPTILPWGTEIVFLFEDHYWSYSLIPVYENGKIGGVYDAFGNMTETVVDAQKLAKVRRGSS